MFRVKAHNVSHAADGKKQSDAGAALFAIRCMRNVMCKVRDMGEFTFQGDRDGTIGKIDNRTAHMGWEMLLGEIPFVIYKGTGYWAGKEKVKFTDQEEIEFLKEFKLWAETKKIKYGVC